MISWAPLEIVAALPEIFVAVSIMALLMIGVFKGDDSTRVIGWFESCL